MSQSGLGKRKSQSGIPSNAYIPPVVGGVLSVIQLVLTWSKLPIVIALFLALFIFVAGALAGQAAMTILRSSGGGRRKSVVIDRVVDAVVIFIALLMCIGMGGDIFITLSRDSD